MIEPTVYFAHGKESGPWGRKIQALAAVAQNLGFRVQSPDYSATEDPDARVAQLLALEPKGAPLVLVGSSMGGYVSAVASHGLAPAGLFLMAPAVYMPDYEATPSPRAGLMEIIHGHRDSIVPVDKAIRLAREHHARLHVLDAEHTLVEALPYLERLFELFLREIVSE